MSNIAETNHLMENLSEENKIFVIELEKRLGEDEIILDKVCAKLCEKVGEEHVCSFQALELESKLQACIEHLIIALASGGIKKEDIENIS